MAEPEATSPDHVVDSLIEQLCLPCAICCTGVLFRDVALEASEATALGALGLPMRPRYRQMRLPQPCPALGTDNRCRIYPQRPALCRRFECQLLQAVRSGRLQATDALRCIAQTRQLADRVRRLLRLLGDRQENHPLLPRVKALQRRLERHPPDEEMAGVWAALTQALHELTVQLQREFYP